jgi:hypothetical protein
MSLNDIAQIKFRENRSSGFEVTMAWQYSDETYNFLIRKARRLVDGLSGKVKLYARNGILKVTVGYFITLYLLMRSIIDYMECEGFVVCGTTVVKEYSRRVHFRS